MEAAPEERLPQADPWVPWWSLPLQPPAWQGQD